MVEAQISVPFWQESKNYCVKRGLPCALVVVFTVFLKNKIERENNSEHFKDDIIKSNATSIDND